MEENNKEEKIYSPKLTTNFLVVLMLLCTTLTISASYLISRETIKDVRKIINENEYSKVWWEENYKILLEIEREEKQKYLDELNKTKPEYIEWLRTKIKDKKQERTLTPEELSILKSNTPIIWNSWATLTLIDFSDFECEYCQSYHNEKIIPEVLESYSWSINYIFKNMPSKKHENAYLLAKYGRCFLENGWDEVYSSYIDNVFSSWSLENIDKTISDFEKSNKIPKEKITTCMDSSNQDVSLEKEIWQWIYLWIKSIPSVVIINSENWKFKIFEWKLTKEDLKSKIDEFVK